MDDKAKTSMPKWLLIFPIVYLCILTALLSHHLRGPSLLTFGNMPLSAPWFGALGGVMVSLQGIFAHNDKWDSSYNYWHIFSGVVGAVFGVFSFLFLIVIVKTSGATMDSNKNSSFVFPLAAFILGYSQQEFPILLRRATSLIFSPGEEHGQKSTARKDQND